MKRIVSIVMIISLMMTSVLLASCSFPLSSGSSSSNTSNSMPTLTPTTTATIETGVLKVGLDYSYAPFAGESNGSVVGIDADISSALAEQLGCTVEFIDVPEGQGDTALANGTVDVVMNVNATSYSSTKVTTIGPYMTDGAALFTLTSNSSASTNATTVGTSTIAAQVGSVSAYQAKSAYSSAKLTSADTLSAAFLNLENASVTYAAADAVVGSYLAQDYDDVVLVGAIGKTSGLYVGVSTANTELQSAVNGAVQTIKGDGVLNVVISKWLGTTLDLPTASDSATYKATSVASTSPNTASASK
jgi:polar amino acid transport system substrate-binding protein